MWRRFLSLKTLMLAGMLCVVLTHPTLAQIKAFPTAEGFGADTIGGRGGTICKVTSLNDSGAGTLRACLLLNQPRIITFAVSGTITLSTTIEVPYPYVTIAGQTSPGGIQIKGNGDGLKTGIWFVSGSHDIIIRHLRIRIGGPHLDDNDQGLLFYGTSSQIYNVIVDHCSFEWNVDATPNPYGSIDLVTLQWNLIAEGVPSPGQTGQGKGIHVGGPGTGSLRVSLHHNAMSTNGIRSPLIQGAAIFDWRNNFVYNWGGNNAGDFGTALNNASAKGNLINNHYVLGPGSGTPIFWIQNTGPTRVDGSAADQGGTVVYTSGNWGPGPDSGTSCVSGCADDYILYGTLDYYNLLGQNNFPAAPSNARTFTPYTVPTVTTHTTALVKSTVLPNVGAYKPSRDSLDQAILDYTTNSTGCSVYTVGCVPSAGGPWPTLSGGAAPTDTDQDGMPDAWETAHGLNPNNAADGNTTAANGYTNIENYLNELAGDAALSTIPAPTGFRFVQTP